MTNRSSVKFKKRVGVNNNVKVKNVVKTNKATNTKNVVKVEKPLLQNAKIKNSGNGNKQIKLAVNRNTRIRVKKT